MRIPEEELQFSFVQSGGPGGQNVNKVSTKAVLHWNVKNTQCLSDDSKERFFHQNQSRIRKDGVLVLQSSKFRTRKGNIEACKAKLEEMLRKASKIPKVRKKTKPTKASKELRLAEKKSRGEKKRLREKMQQE